MAKGASGVPWTLFDVAPELAQFADEVAVAIAGHRMQGTPHYFRAWVEVALEERRPYDDRERDTIAAFLRPGLGTVSEPAVPDHVEGLVAEHIWHLVQTRVPTDEPVRYLSPPKFHPTAPGGDGLVLFGEATEGFRLWEVKKANRHVSSTVSSAYRQLKSNALEYLAQMTGIGQEMGRVDLVPAFSNLTDRWLEGRPNAAAGVAIAASEAPNSCFTTMRTALDHLDRANGHRGAVYATGDLPGFARQVRNRLFTGL